MNKVHQTQRLGLKDALKWREVNDHKLPNKTASYSVIEHFIAEEFDFASEDRLGFGPTGQCIEHVKKHETSERHSCIAGSNFAVDAHLTVVCKEGAEHNDGSGLQDALEEGPG